MRRPDGAATTPSSCGHCKQLSDYGQVADTILMAVIFM
jgi:hypothetical protein